MTIPKYNEGMRAGTGLIASIIVVACGAAGEPVADASPDDCRPQTGQRVTCRIEHGGRTREYEIYAPASAKGPAPLVVNLHGRKGTASEQAPRLIAQADRYGFVLVSPQGYERSWNAGVGFGPAHEQGLDDVGFIRAVVGRVAASTSIDRGRVYATGLSNGARMSHRLACEASDVFAAIASVAGPIADRNEETGERAFACKPARAVPVMMIHGKRDLCTPYDGGSGLDTTGNVATPVAAAEWSQRNGCTTTTTHALGSTICEVHRDCRDGGEVALCAMTDGGHVWPGGPKFALWQACGGTWPDDFVASDQMWSFFVVHPMPPAEQVPWQPLAVAPREGGGHALEVGPVEGVDLPMDRSQLTLALRGTGPSAFDGSNYQDGSVALGGAVSLYSRLRVRPRRISFIRVAAQFRLEGERVTTDMLARDQQITKAALGVSALYYTPAHRLYAAYAGAAIAETRDTLSSPELMPTVIALGTTSLRSKLTWIYGGGFGYALGRPWLLPAAGLAWRPGSWTLTTILPIFVDVRRTLSRRLHAHAILSVSGDRFNFANGGTFGGAADTLQLRLGQARLGLGVGYRFNRSWSLRAELGAVGPRKLTIADGDTMVAASESRGAGYVSTAVSYGFGNSPL